MLYTRYLLPVLILFASAFYVVATPVHHVELVACAERQPEVSVLGVVTDQLDILKKLSNKIRDWIINQEVKAATTKLASEIVPQVIGSYTNATQYLAYAAYIDDEKISEQIANVTGSAFEETISIFEYWSPDDINSIIQQSGGDAQVDKFCITLGQLIKLLELLYEIWELFGLDEAYNNYGFNGTVATVDSWGTS